MKLNRVLSQHLIDNIRQLLNYPVQIPVEKESKLSQNILVVEVIVGKIRIRF